MTDTEKELLQYLGIPNYEWPVCQECNKKIAFIISNDDSNPDKIGSKARVKIQCKKCRRETDEHKNVIESINEWNRFYN